MSCDDADDPQNLSPPLEAVDNADFLQRLVALQRRRVAEDPNCSVSRKIPPTRHVTLGKGVAPPRTIAPEVRALVENAKRQTSAWAKANEAIRSRLADVGAEDPP